MNTKLRVSVVQRARPGYPAGVRTSAAGDIDRASPRRQANAGRCNGGITVRIEAD